MLVYREFQTFTRILIDNLIYDLGIMAIMYEIWNCVGPRARYWFINLKLQYRYSYTLLLETSRIKYKRRW